MTRYASKPVHYLHHLHPKKDWTSASRNILRFSRKKLSDPKSPALCSQSSASLHSATLDCSRTYLLYIICIICIPKKDWTRNVSWPRKDAFTLTIVPLSIRDFDGFYKKNDILTFDPYKHRHNDRHTNYFFHMILPVLERKSFFDS